MLAVGSILMEAGSAATGTARGSRARWGTALVEVLGYSPACDGPDRSQPDRSGSILVHP